MNEGMKKRIERAEDRLDLSGQITPRILVIQGADQAEVDREIERLLKAGPPEGVEYETIVIVPAAGAFKLDADLLELRRPLSEADLAGKSPAEVKELLARLQEKARALGLDPDEED